MKLSVLIPVWEQEELVKKAIESIPRRDDIEIIAIDDGSTDNSFKSIQEYDYVRAYRNEKNIGAGLTRNKLIELATGEYIIFLDSDDYFYPKLEEFMTYLDGTDMVFYGLIENDGVTIMPTPDNIVCICGTVKAIRREFIGDCRFPDLNFAEDWHFNKALLDKNPTKKFTNMYLLHYNHPREGSLFDLGTRKEKK